MLHCAATSAQAIKWPTLKLVLTPLIIGESSNEALVILATLWYIEGEQKKYTNIFKSGGNILGQSASKR